MRQIIFFCALGISLVACDSAKEDTANLNTCEVADDCNMHISVWDPSCDTDGNTLLTPTGTGLGECVEGECVYDFEVVETDCSENGQVCQNDDVGIGSCVDATE